MPGKAERIFVAGHKGMVGSALVRKLQSIKNVSIVTADRSDLDLTNQVSVLEFFASQSIGQVYLAAAKVGGIHANNTYPADFIYENLMIEANVINAAHRSNVQKLLFLGSSCIYPKFAKQPMSEDTLLTGTLEPTNEPYALAKIAGIKLCESYNRQHGRDYRSVMPTNLYGPHDNFHPQNSHVVPAMIRRFHQAKIQAATEVVIWGTGSPRREFLHVDDMADACLHVMNLNRDTYLKGVNPMLSHVNIGTGKDCTIRELAELIAEVVGFKGSLIFDHTKADGAPRKLLDVSRMSELGWHAKIDLLDGISSTYNWFLNNNSEIRN